MSEIPLSTWANLAEIIGAGSIITGLLFGWFQIRQFRVQQSDAVAITLAQTFYNRDLAVGIVATTCRKLRRWLEELREEQQRTLLGGVV